jgi:hypothetical protein
VSADLDTVTRGFAECRISRRRVACVEAASDVSRGDQRHQLGVEWIAFAEVAIEVDFHNADESVSGSMRQQSVDGVFMDHVLSKIVSGGQTGVDRAALDVALELGLSCGGWCPRGRRAEDGPIDARYPLTETPWDGYPQRTRWNVRDSDGTLILTLGEPRGGTALTVEYAQRLDKPYLTLDLTQAPDPAAVRDWALKNKVGILNVAGPRAGEDPGVYEQAVRFLRRVLS